MAFSLGLEVCVMTLLVLATGISATGYGHFADLVKNPYSSQSSGRIVIPGDTDPSALTGHPFPAGSRFGSWWFNQPTVPRVFPAWTPPVCNDPPIVCPEEKFRNAEGTCNNLQHPYWGTPRRPQARLLPAQYNDNVSQPRIKGPSGTLLPSARIVSQVVHSADNPLTESIYLTHFFTVWGQFLDHDITLTPMVRETDGGPVECCNETMMFPNRGLYWMPTEPIHHTAGTNPECFAISIPYNDRHFRTSCMNFVRSRPFAPTARCQSATREQGNAQTAFIDGSQVYGPAVGDHHALRAFSGGLLKSEEIDLLPSNSTTMCTKRPATADFCFGSGDPRVNEHPMLSSLHIVFHRLHNLLATELAVLNPHWDDERIFQEARKIVGAVMQRVTYAEYLPLVLGKQVLRSYNLDLYDPTYKYDSNVDPTILNSFSTAAFRFGHSMINGRNSYGYQTLNLKDMFFHPHFVQHDQGAGLRMVLNGLIRDRAQTRDRFINNDLTDHLFETSDGHSLDLASLNIQRGRDHGLPPFNDFREFCGLPRVRFPVPREFHDTPFLAAYNDLDEIDLYSGGLAEKPVPGGVVGPTFACIIGRQFRNIRFGDRFWYQNINHIGAFKPEQIRYVESLNMSDVLCLTSCVEAVQVNVFEAASIQNPVRQCPSTPPLNLSAWKDV